MLFDLRGRGRRNVIKVVYIALAFLMGGGLVFFGIGGNTGSGGLVDAFTDGGGDIGADEYEKDIADARARLRTRPNDESAYVDLIRAQVSLATTGEQYNSADGTYTEAGLADLREAVTSWEQYQEIDPQNAEDEASVASRMVQAYFALEDPEGLVDAQEVIALNRETVGPYAALAQYAYAAGQIRKGDLAAKKAIELEDPDQRKALKTNLDAVRGQAPGATASPVPSASPKAEPEKDGAQQKGKQAQGGGKGGKGGKDGGSGSSGN